MGLREHLTRFGDYRAWAIALAAELRRAGHPDLPRAPHIATFRCTPRARPTRSTSGSSRYVEQHGIVPSGTWRDAEMPGWVVTELTCYDSAADRDPAEVAEQIAAVVA